MLYFYVTIYDKTLEVMILDGSVLCIRLHLWGRCKRKRSLILSINRYGIYLFFEKTTQYRRSVSLKFEYELKLLHKTHKR